MKKTPQDITTIPRDTIGGVDTALARDHAATELLEQMLITLKKIEFHLSIASDTTLKDEDV